MKCTFLYYFFSFFFWIFLRGQTMKDSVYNLATQPLTIAGVSSLTPQIKWQGFFFVRNPQTTLLNPDLSSIFNLKSMIYKWVDVSFCILVNYFSTFNINFYLLSGLDFRFQESETFFKKIIIFLHNLGTLSV